MTDSQITVLSQVGNALQRCLSQMGKPSAGGWRIGTEKQREGENEGEDRSQAPPGKQLEIRGSNAEGAQRTAQTSPVLGAGGRELGGGRAV